MVELGVGSFVLVHGAAHGGWCWKRVAGLLRNAGHDVYAPTLTGLGERSHLLGPHVDLDLHICDVDAVLRYEDLRDVVLVGHSYGGMIITGAADRSPERVGKLVYLDSGIPGDGQSLADLAPTSSALRARSQVLEGVEVVLVPKPGATMLYGVSDPSDLAWMADRLTPHPWRCFEQQLRLNHRVDIPKYHIVCDWDIVARDEEAIETAKVAGRVWEMDSGHDAMISAPEETANLLLKIAAD